MNLIDTLNQIWTQILDVMSIFVMPDWGFLIGLLPVLIVLGVVGPLPDRPGARDGRSTWSASRGSRSTFVEGPRVAADRRGGEPIFPVGLPPLPARRPGLRAGMLRCDTTASRCSVVCPMCGLGRLALVDTCTNCGLVLKVKPRARRPSGRRAGPQARRGRGRA